jgi:hypothetical protein
MTSQPSNADFVDQDLPKLIARWRAKRMSRVVALDKGRSSKRPRPIQRVVSIADLHPAVDGRYYVYFVRGAGLVKIGTSRDPRGRIADLCGTSPVPLEFLFAWRVNCLQSIKGNLELAAHRHFKDCRSHGEWFALTDDQIEACHRSLWWVVGGDPAFTRRFRKPRAVL